jgi:TM2 domain-containing membrane protein YozV
MTRCIALTALACALAVHGADSVSVETSAAPLPGTTSASTEESVLLDTVAATADSQSTRNPWVAAMLSAALPGAGQVYNRRYVKGALYLAVETGLALYSINRYGAGDKYDDDIKRFNGDYESLRDSLGVIDTSAWTYSDRVVYDTVVDGTLHDTLQVADSIPSPTVYRMSRDTARVYRRRIRNTSYQAAWWAASLHVYGILDALEKTGRFENDEPRNPRLAGWLSAVPFLGLGQWYNGRPSKAGLIFMVQSSLAYMALNNHLLMVEAEDQLDKLNDPGSQENAVMRTLSGNGFYRTWESIYDDAFRKRNTYLWYSLFFYFYNVFDAVVDAHLHDYRRKMRLEPDLRLPDSQIGLRLSVEM